MTKSNKPTHWTQSISKLPDDHKWQSKPGYNVFVANAGVVRFDFPAAWIVSPGDDSIRFWDRQPPDDDCVLQVSIHTLPAGIDWSGLPLRNLLKDLSGEEGPNRKPLGKGKIIDQNRPGLEISWFESRILDTTQHREAISRLCLARGGNTQIILTFDFWPKDLNRLDSVWNEALRSLRIGDVLDMTGASRGMIPDSNRG